jgi:hypothetical protein
MSIISDEAFIEQENFNTIRNFLKRFHVGAALKKANAYKMRGIPVMSLMLYLIQLVYTGKSMFRDSVSKQSVVGGSMDAVYRFLRNTSTNWNTLMLHVSQSVTVWLRALTSDERLTALVLDDTYYGRQHSKKTELVSMVHDHTDHRTKRGFRSLFLAWTDGATLIPVSFRHMASGSKRFRCSEIREGTDMRTSGAKAKREAITKSTDVALRMLRDAKRSGIPAKHVLFDSWFTYPVFVLNILDIGYHVVGRLKNTEKVFYSVGGKQQTLKQIFAANRKRRGRSRYLLSVQATIKCVDGRANSKSTDVRTADARIVFVRNRNKRNEWIAFLCTDPKLTEDEIIALYGKRWSIEVFFKTCKSYLRFTGEFRQQSYEAITAHTAIVAIRFMILAVEQRQNVDNRRTPGDLFFLFQDEVRDITFNDALVILIRELINFVVKQTGIDKDTLDSMVQLFISTLPKNLGLLLRRNYLAAS